MEFLLGVDIKVIIIVCMGIAVLFGFYVSTQSRLTFLESQVLDLNRQIDAQMGDIWQLKDQAEKEQK